MNTEAVGGTDLKEAKGVQNNTHNDEALIELHGLARRMFRLTPEKWAKDNSG